MQEYLKVVDELTINEEKRLKRENEMLKVVTKSEIEQLKQQAEEYKTFQSSQLKQLQDQIIALNKKIGKQNPYDLSSDLKDFRKLKEITVVEEVREHPPCRWEDGPALIRLFKERGYDKKQIVQEMATHGFYDFETIKIMKGQGYDFG